MKLCVRVVGGVCGRLRGCLRDGLHAFDCCARPVTCQLLLLPQPSSVPCTHRARTSPVQKQAITSPRSKHTPPSRTNLLPEPRTPPGTGPKRALCCWVFVVGRGVRWE